MNAAEPLDPDSAVQDTVRRRVLLRRETPHILPLVLAMLLGVMTLGIAMGDEPLHVDELFQASNYERSWSEVFEGAVAQTQPPLDYIVGAAAERLLGSSDFVRRLPATVAGIASLFLLGLLARRSGAPEWLAVLLLATAPLFIEFSAYARPYAIPLALMFGFLLSVDLWRTNRSPWSMIVCLLVSLLLPLSRTTEPPLFLGFALVILIWIRLKGGHAARWTVWPMATAAVGLAIAAAVMTALSSEIAKYDAGGINSLSTVVERVTSDIAHPYMNVMPWGGLAVLVGFAGLIYGVWAVYSGHFEYWWIVPLGLVAFAMPVVFAGLADANQAFLPRYTYFFWPSYAIGAAVIARVGGTRVGAVIVVAFLALAIPASVNSLLETHNPDYKTAGTRALDTARDGDVIIWERGRSHDEWRPTIFPGFELYFDSPSDFYSSEVVAAVGIEDGQRPLILAQELEKPPPGWTGVEVTAQFAVWIPDESAGGWGPVSQGEALRSVCRQVPADSGAATCVAAARLLVAGGDRRGGAELLAETEARLQSDSMRRRFEQWTQDILQG